jgi:small subunit ribosomal protein S20
VNAENLYFVDLGAIRGYTRPLFGQSQGLFMPNIASAKKRVRTTAKRTAINTARKTRVRGFIRKVEEAIASGDKKAALAALKAAEPEIMRGVSKGVLHKNTGSRKVSRLTKRVSKLSK